MFLKLLIIFMSLIFNLCEGADTDTLNSSLEELRNKKITFDVFTSKLKSDTTSTSLSLDSGDLDEDWKVIDFAINLSQNKTIEKLSLNKPKLFSTFTTAIRGILKCNDSIKEFSLICNDDFPQDEVGSLISGLTWCNKSQVLKKVTLSHLGINIPNVISTFKNKLFKINTLCLSNNKIDSNGAKNLFESLKENTTITFLDLDNNKISDEGCFEIANLLKFNTTLKTLYLDGNEIQSDGAKAIASALQINKSLAILAIQRNPFGEEGINAFSGLFLRKQLSITTLWIGGINDRKCGYVTLGNNLRDEPNLSILGLLGSITLEEAQNFIFLLSINQRITLKLSDKHTTKDVKEILQKMRDDKRIQYI